MNRPLRFLFMALWLSAAATLLLQAQSDSAKKQLLVPGVTSAVEAVPSVGADSHPGEVAGGADRAAGAAPSVSGVALGTGGASAAAGQTDLPTPFDPKELDGSWLKFDQNGDGRTDYAAKLDESGHKVREALDFNYDGYFDDFLYYARGVLVREEIDSNFDRKIDIWIYIDGGVYIGRTEQDKNFDGIPDVIKNYGKKR